MNGVDPELKLYLQGLAERLDKIEKRLAAIEKAITKQPPNLGKKGAGRF